MIIRMQRTLTTVALAWILLNILRGASADDDPAVYPFVRAAQLGFIDKAGKVVVEPRFDPSVGGPSEKRGSSEGLYPVSKDSKWGYIDAHGVLKIPLQFSLATRFSEGLAAVRVGAKFG